MKKIAIVATLLAIIALAFAGPVFAQTSIVTIGNADVDWDGSDEYIKNVLVTLSGTETTSNELWTEPWWCGFLKASNSIRSAVGITNLRERIYRDGICILDEGYWDTALGGWAVNRERLYDTGTKSYTILGSSITTQWSRDGMRLERKMTWLPDYTDHLSFDGCIIEYKISLGIQLLGHVALGILWTCQRPVPPYSNTPEGALQYIKDRMFTFWTHNYANYEGITEPGLRLEISFTFDDAMKEWEPEPPFNGLIGWDGGSLEDFENAGIYYTDGTFSPTTAGVNGQPQGSKSIWGICHLPNYPTEASVVMETGALSGTTWQGVGPTGRDCQRVYITFPGLPNPPKGLPPVVYVSPTSNTGQTFTANIEASNVVNLYGWEGNLTFDPTVLQCTGVGEGPFLASGGPVFWVDKSVDNAKGLMRFAAALYNVTKGVNGTGVLASASFKAVKLENSSISLTNVALIDPLGAGLGPPVLINGHFSPTHDLMAKSVTVPDREVYPGWNIATITSNVGNYEETANVTAYINDTVIGRHAAPIPPETDDRIEMRIPMEPDLGPDLQLYENYTLRVEVSPVPGETILGDNVYIYGSILIRMTGDVNCDKKVNILDIYAAAKAFGSKLGEPRYDVTTDLSCDGVINIVDIFGIAIRFGWSWTG